MHKNPFPPNGGSPLSSPRLKPGASRGYSVKRKRAGCSLPARFLHGKPGVRNQVLSDIRRKLEDCFR